MATRYIFIVCVCVKLCSAHRLISDFEQRIKWAPEFHLRAEKLDLKSGVTEPMEMWYSEHLNRSRIDYYGGTVKKYYTWNPGTHVTFVDNVIPVSTEDIKNKIICLKVAQAKNLHKILPIVEKYDYVEGERMHEGRLVETWQFNHVVKDRAWKEETLYTIRNIDHDIPVQLVVKVYLTAKSNLYAHLIYNYFSYNSTVEDAALDPPRVKCYKTRKLDEDFHRAVEHLHPSKETDVNFAFHSYKKHHNKNYKIEDEHEIRKIIFQRNWEMIIHHNRQNLGYRLELNHFADLTADEVSEVTGLLPTRAPPTHAFPHSDDEVQALAEELPLNYDMRVEGYISAVKNQAYCGSCWAFSSAAAVEGALARSNGGRILDLSEQSMVDCSWGFKNRGCFGGHMSRAFMYIMKHGIPMEEEYGPYLETEGFCHAENVTKTYNIKGFAAVTHLNPLAMKVALYKYGPVSISVHLNDKLRFFASGIFYDPDCNKGRVNHGMTVVGYGVRDGVDFWIVKNSYGADWGEGGYLLISAADNNCLVLGDPVYPVV